MNPQPLVAATTTVTTREQADQLAREILAQGHAACVQVEGPITSHYRWQGVLEEATEWRLTIKTTAAAEPALAQLVHRLHPYDLPQWWVAFAEHASPGYTHWVQQALERPGEHA